MTASFKPLLAGILILAFAGCSKESSIPVAPDETLPAQPDRLAAKPNCDVDPSHPSCGGDDGGGDGDGGSSADPTVDLSGNYAAASQSVDVSEGGKYLRINAPAEAPISMSVNLPTIGVDDFPGTCSHQGFADDAAAADFWNAHATEGGDDRRLRIQVDKKAEGTQSTSHFTEVFWNSGELFIKMRNGNHTEYGAATWTGGNDSYTLTGGGLSLILPNTDIAVGCDAAVLGTSFTFDLTR